MLRIKPFSIIIICLLVLGIAFYWIGFASKSHEVVQSKVETTEQKIKKLLFQYAYLRDYQKIPNIEPESYLAIYVNDSKVDTPKPGWNYDASCSESSEGRAIEGIYYLALIQNDKIVNDIKLPGYEATQLDDPMLNALRIVYQHTKSHVYYRDGGEKPPAEHEYDLVDIKLLNLQDLNGDGEKMEFILDGRTFGCGHTEHLIAGYDKANNKAIVYPIINKGKTTYWMDRFWPDASGKVETGWGCGDHGTEIEDKSVYKYDSQKEGYIFVENIKKKCYK